jgi:preprotein translocase subunit SecA
MRRFGTERIGGWMDRLGMEEDQPIEHRFISKSIESAQTKVEGHNFDRRKNVVDYDDVMNRHREVIYGDRRKIVAGEDVHEKIASLIDGQIEVIVDASTNERDQTIDLDRVLEAYHAIIPGERLSSADLDGLAHDELVERLIQDGEQAYSDVEARFTTETLPKVERHILLMVIDKLWVDHLTAMDDLRQGVGLQAYGQRDPLVVYKTEGYQMFNKLLLSIQHDVVRSIFRVQPVAAQQPIRTRVTDTEMSTNAPQEPQAASQRRTKKVRPNEPCPCGSGKKYKFCHGARAKTVV